MTDSINATVDYNYDGLGQLIKEEVLEIPTTYTYDTRGNRIGMNKGGIISQYTYDASNRLLSQVENVGGVNEQQTTYTYDNNGNLILRQTGQLSDSASQTESVSLTGQTEQIPNTIEGASMVWYEYNSFGQLSGVSTDTGMQASYTYDAMGRRASKTVNGVEKRHLWNGDRISAEADANDTITDTYFQLGSLSAHKTGDEFYYYIYDGHGSVVAMKNESQSGDATAVYNYDAFGNPLSDPMLTNPFRYCNEYYDTETDMIYLRNRYYDPSIGRFITEDPARDGLNWYAYCNNNPVMFVDPSGMISVIFVGTGMEDQADMRKTYYTEKYNTDSYKISISSAENFVTRWNEWFSLCAELGIQIDAIEVISHGSIKGGVGTNSDGTAYSTGYLYFTDKKDNNLYAREIKGMKKGDKAVTELNSVVAKELNINGCNGANPDTYNVVYGFMQKVKAKSYTGFDGGAQWDWTIGDHIPGGGYYDANRPWYKGGPWYYVKTYQSTWWKYVNKENGTPNRERTGRRFFEGGSK